MNIIHEKSLSSPQRALHAGNTQKSKQTDKDSFFGLFTYKIPYILESNPHLVLSTFWNEKKLVRASNPHLSFNRPLPTGRLFE
jgi:hypothetical protein